jgi:hypothetical protein
MPQKPQQVLVQVQNNVPGLQHDIQGVPVLTGPGISLIILKPMKILQQDLNRSTLIV